jgi:hypothetical protein
VLAGGADGDMGGGEGVVADVAVFDDLHGG